MEPEAEPDVLDRVQRRVLWLATAIVHHANRRPNPSGIKVGGHQASSASMVSLMTALWFGALPCFLSGALMFAARHVRPETIQ